MTAIPVNGYRFDGWSGNSTGQSANITMEMTCNKTLAANFVQVKYRVQTTVMPVAGGGIILEPSQPADGYNSGTVITLRANPDDGYAFTGWSGDISGQQNLYTLTMDDNKSITAAFEARRSNMAWLWMGVGVVVVLAGVMAVPYFILIKKKRIN